jgi:Ca2+:H+ antiporter
MTLQFWPGAVAMILLATITASFISNSGRRAWFNGVVILGVYFTFAIALYLLPPR